MTYHEYSHGPQSGYKGWIDNADGETVAYVNDSGKIVTEW